MPAFKPVSITTMRAAWDAGRATLLTNAQDVHTGMTVYAHATTSGADDPKLWSEYVPHRVTRRWKNAIQLVALSDGTACSFAPYEPSTWDLRHDEVFFFATADDACAAQDGIVEAVAATADGIAVNTHGWLTHEHGDRAIERRDIGELRMLAREADTVGATGVADHWRAMARQFAQDAAIMCMPRGGDFITEPRTEPYGPERNSTAMYIVKFQGGASGVTRTTMKAAVAAATHHAKPGQPARVYRVGKVNVHVAIVHATGRVEMYPSKFVCSGTYTGHWPTAAGDTCRRCGAPISHTA